jgi:hypothetical protein
MPNQKFFNDTHYRGLKVDTSHGPLIEPYLERAHDTLCWALSQHRRLFAIRVDLRFPQIYWPLEGEVLGNEYLTRFIDSLDAKIQHRQRVAASQGCRIHEARLRYIWAREYSEEGQRPHYHILIILNGDAYNALGSFEGPGLASRIREAWASALGMACIDANGLAHFPENPEYHVSDSFSQPFQELFFRVSYFCKAWSKNPFDGCYPFGHSRK